MAASRPVTQDDYDQVRELHKQRKSRNEIARITGRSGRTVSRLAGELGLSFERAGATAAATAAKKADAATRRAAIEDAALEAAQKLLGQMFAPTKVFNFGGRENDYNEREHTEPPFADKRAIATSVQALMQTALKIAEHDKADQEVSGVDAWLVAMEGDG